MRSNFHVVVGITDTLQCVHLANVKGGYVRVTKSESLPQVGVSFKKILVFSYLKILKQTA